MDTIKKTPFRPLPVSKENNNFWECVAKADHRLLSLDYDGTLAPFHIDRMQVRLYPGIQGLLCQIRDTGRTQLAIVSGRPMPHLHDFLDDLRIPLIGSHGWEFYFPEGDSFTYPLNDIQQEGFKQAKDCIKQLGYISLLAEKASSIAVYTQAIKENEAREIEQVVFNTWNSLADGKQTECRYFKQGVEFRAIGHNKGDALQYLHNLQPEGNLTVHIGDDDSDEDAFRFLRNRGIGIKVGDGNEPTEARGYLADCQAVKEFLEAWLHAIQPS